MRFAILGTDDHTISLAKAAVEAEHELVWLGDLRPEDDDGLSSLGAGRPIPTPSADWESVLDPTLCDAVIAGQGTVELEARIERIKRLVADAIPTLVTFPIGPSVLPYYELDMMRQGVEGILRCYSPLDQVETLHQMNDWVATNQPTVGEIQHITWVRHLAECSRERVVEAIACDAFALRNLIDKISKVSAFGPKLADSNYASLNVQFSGPLQKPIQWSASKTDADECSEVTLVGDTGKVVVTIPESATVAWSIEIVDGSGDGQTDSAVNDNSTLAIEQLEAAIGQDDRSSPTRSNWELATRAMEIVDALQLSLQKGRTVEVLHQQLTEHLAFKGIMSAFGCGLLLLGMFLLVVVGVLGDSLGIPLVGLWPFVLAAVFLVFLLLQVVPFAAGKTGEDRRSRSP